MKKAIAIAVMFVFAMAAVSFAGDMTVTGTVKAVDAKAMTLTVTGAKKGDVALTANDKTKVMAGKDAKTLADVKVGDKVKATYMSEGGKDVAKKIEITAAPAAAPAAKPAAPAPAKPAAGGY